MAESAVFPPQDRGCQSFENESLCGRDQRFLGAGRQYVAAHGDTFCQIGAFVTRYFAEIGKMAVVQADRMMQCRGLANAELENGIAGGTGQLDAREPEAGRGNVCHGGIPEQHDILFLQVGQ